MASQPAEGLSVLRVSVVTLTTSFAVLALWCGVDWIWVRNPEWRSLIRSWEVLAIPVVLVSAFVAHWRLHGGSRVGLAGLTSVLSCLMAVPLVFYLGIGFHLWIGGDL